MIDKMNTWFERRQKEGQYPSEVLTEGTQFPRPENVDVSVYGHFIRVPLGEYSRWGFHNDVLAEAFAEDFREVVIELEEGP